MDAAVPHGLNAVGDLKKIDRDSFLRAIAVELAKYPLRSFRLRRWLREYLLHCIPDWAIAHRSQCRVHTVRDRSRFNGHQINFPCRGTTMLRQPSFAVILVGKSILLREGLARILRAANFRILASVSSADDLRPSKATLHLPLYLIVHTGDDFDRP